MAHAGPAGRDAAEGDVALHVGTYGRAGGQGLYPLMLAADDGMTLGEPFAGAPNASFGVHAADRATTYFVDESEVGRVGAFARVDGRWVARGVAPTLGAEPCYVACAGARLAIANYASGSVALVPLAAETGLFAGAPVAWANQGHGPDQDRQATPHAHCVQFSADGRWLFVVDLGTDQIIGFKLDGAAGQALSASPRIVYQAPPGSGPRHLLLHPDGRRAVLVSELASIVSLLVWEDDRFACIDHHATLPADHIGTSQSGHLALNAAGDRIYVSNRGHDSIAVFAVEGDRIRPIQHVAAGGASPRFFLLLEDRRRIVLANEQSASIRVFAIDDQGCLTLLPSAIDVPGACFLLRTEAGA